MLLPKLIPGCNGAVFKKNGKYVFFEYKVLLSGSLLQQTSKTIKEFKIIVKEKYDTLYEVNSYVSYTNTICLQGQETNGIF